MYRSFYWRIAISFIVLVATVLAIQVGLFAIITARMMTAAPPLYVVMSDGEMLASQQETIDEATRQRMTGALRGDLRTLTITPLYADGSRRGMIVRPSGPPPALRQSLLRLVVPGTIVLALATAVAAFVIFRPARERLRDLEAAAERLGGGDLTARALVNSRDEIAHVAAAFNRMAAEFAARDDSLRASDRLRRQMLADVSHELRTPLTAMRGYVESLRMAGDTLAPEKRERYFATLERETLRLDRIVKDLLDLGRLEDQTLRFEVRVFAVGRVFERVIARHEVEASAHRITFHMRVDDRADQMQGDPHRIEQVVEILVANALRHTAADGSIELEATRDDGAVRLLVADSGEGIPAEHLPYIFERFYKADSSRARSSGSGLGLSIGKAIVERHGGGIAVESHPGRTAFVLTFPQDDAYRS
jgi:signal transduction histidine kinase